MAVRRAGAVRSDGSARRTFNVTWHESAPRAALVAAADRASSDQASGWVRAEIDVVRLAAFCGQLMS